MKCLILLWLDDAWMDKYATSLNGRLILTVVPEKGDEYYKLNVKLEEGWLWEKMFALSEWEEFPKSSLRGQKTILY